MRGLIFFIALLLVLQTAVASDYHLIISGDDYCDCDDDCGEMQSCLTRDTDEYIKKLKKDSLSRIEEAEEEDFKGVCAELYFDTNKVPYHMTPCNETEGNNETEVVEENIENLTDVDIKLEQRNTTVTEEEVGGETEKISGLVVVNGEKEEGVMLRTPVIASITVIVIGFFALIGWFAYLLQKR